MFLNKNLSTKLYHSLLFVPVLALLVCSCDRSASESNAQVASMTDSSTPAHSSEESVQSIQENSSVKKSANIDESRKNAITKAVNEVSPAVVNITVTEVVQGAKRVPYGIGFFRRYIIVPFEQNISSIGSGFIISEEGLIVTSAHVSGENAKKIIITLADGSQYEAELVGADELSDIALLKINADREFPFVEFGDSDQVLVGEWAIALGNPFGLFQQARPSVTVGVVSAVQRDFRPNPQEPRVYLDMIQTDAAINQGNSGGPLVNSAGKVIGINTFIYTGGTGAGFVGLGFAIPSNRAKLIIGQLAEDGEYEKRYDLGMQTSPTTYRVVMNNRLYVLPGLVVTSVNRDGPAFKSGIIPGDIILKYGNTTVQSRMHARALLREYEVGDSLRVEFVRDRNRYETKIYLRERVSGE